MSLFIISGGKGVPALVKDLPQPEADATNFRFLVGRGVTTMGLNLRVTMPAVYDEDFAFQVVDGSLILFGVRRRPAGFGDYKKFALRYGNFRQRVALPHGLDSTSVAARFHHGVLDVQIDFSAVAVRVAIPQVLRSKRVAVACPVS